MSKRIRLTLARLDLIKSEEKTNCGEYIKPLLTNINLWKTFKMRPTHSFLFPRVKVTKVGCISSETHGSTVGLNMQNIVKSLTEIDYLCARLKSMFY